MKKQPCSQSNGLTVSRQLALSAYWLAVNLHWGALLVVMMPSQISKIAPKWDSTALSYILGIGALVALVMPPLVGAFSDRCSSRLGRRRPYMLAGLLVNVVGLLILWTAGFKLSFGMYLAGYLVVQFGNNLTTGSYNGMIPDIVPKDQVGEASGYMAAMTQLGTVAGAMISGYLMGHGHAGASYAVIIASLAVFMAVTVFGVKETPIPPQQGKVNLKNVLRSLWIDPRKYPNFAWVWGTRALVTMGMWTVQPYIQYYLRDILKVKNPEQMAGTMLGVILIGATITGIIGGSLSDRIGRKRIVYFSNIVIAAASLGFLFTRTLDWTFAVAILYGLGFGAYFSVDWALGCDVLPNKDDAAKDMGVWHISMVLPQSLAPFIAGPILQHFSNPNTHSHTIAGYTTIFGMAAFFLILAALFLRNVKGVR